MFENLEQKEQKKKKETIFDMFQKELGRNISPMEYEITRLIKQANDARKPTVGFVQGHGESRFSAMPQFMGELAHLSQIQHVRLDTSSNLNSNNVICIIDPQDSFTADELAVLERYLKQRRWNRFMMR